ncbi:RPA12/RPB9/RPC11 RNA polymerase family protein [Halorarius litoreus]|uniref:RPA12/RPB9/RPC11 RNA polymerase family protein n=1 Tax=Halorarius litoreus TaxID=2962676 RepID=UPI0020CEFFF2|nr:DNA-directed RNA polymerase subunit M [Halorarius litoreus]
MQFCDECGSMMHTEGGTWVCRSCGHEQARDSHAEAEMSLREDQQDDGTPSVAEADHESTETVRQACPEPGCDSDRANYKMMPKPGGSYEVRLFTCVECGRKWRES